MVRGDLKMGVGKTATQVAHAAVLGAEKSRQTDFATFSKWLDSGQAKVVLKVRSLEELIGVRQTAEELFLPVVLIEEPSPKHFMTGLCICIGPAQSTSIDKVTRHLKLL